jgi:uncharacterized oligopeptide transporter (OPT) family protein
MSPSPGPAVSPAYLGVGYIIGPTLGSLNFAGGLLAWGLFVPLLIYFLGPELARLYTPPGLVAGSEEARERLAVAVWYNIVRPIAVGGMLVGATYTLFRMRKNLAVGIKRGVADLKKSARAEATDRTERDLSASRSSSPGSPSVFVLMIALYFYFTGRSAPPSSPPS